ncbi:GspH/FimT family pseudopilin [Neptuniibacter sp. QD48_11]|uniref:GspH/FimT family pseudopilin n=1 Tax=unclassified Neptuniibacter TaxID=2630693 RepID=UPI0039F52019
MNKLHTYKGFTLIELMVTLAVLAILISLAAPSLNDFQERVELTGAAEKVYGHIQYARSESISNGSDIYIAFKGTGAAGWCMGISDTAACDCSSAASLALCTINSAPARYVTGSDYPSVELSTNLTSDDSGFLSPRSTSMENGTITLNYPGYGDAKVVLSTIGRVRLCSDTLDIYAGCP